jgi:hypothetical protein
VLAKGILEKRIERAILLGIDVRGNASRVTLEPNMVHVRLLAVIVKGEGAGGKRAFPSKRPLS